MRPFEVVRELTAGLVAAVAFLLSHYLLAFPHWQIPGMAWALEVAVALAAYAGVRLAWSARPGLVERWLGLEMPLRPAAADTDPESLRAALHFTADAARPRLTEPVREALDRVVEAVEAVLAAQAAASAGREAAYTLQATVTQYLPDTLERYLKLPRRFATRREVRDGKTARDLVMEQLEILATELESIADEIHQGEAIDLAAHGRFLEERFSRHDPLKT